MAFGLVSAEKALSSYGVVVGDGCGHTEAERARQREERGEAKAFDFGPEMADALANCEAETGLKPPQPATPLRWSPLESGEAARARVRAAWEAEISEGNGHP